MTKSYCLSCKEEVSQDTEKCECGGQYFVFGNDFSFNDKGVVCDCGSDEFNTIMHMDYTDKAVNNFVCVKCNNRIGTEYYRSEDDLML